MSIVNLLRQIVQCNPQITVLSMSEFSRDKDGLNNIGQLVLEIILSSSIDSITDLNLSHNVSWFAQNQTYGLGNVDLLIELITKQTGLQKIYLSNYDF